MWKLKFGAEGENVDPYLFSTNEFVGRQIWEFDPHAGTPQERAELHRERNFKQTIPQVKIEDDDEECRHEKATVAFKGLLPSGLPCNHHTAIGPLNILTIVRKCFGSCTVTRTKMVGGDYT
ncbi:unnamed protein product [Prunus brigantina]